MIQLFQQFFFMSLFHLYAYAPPPDVAVRILHAAEVTHSNPFQLAGQVYAETRYDTGKVSSTGCRGLLQVSWTVKEKYGAQGGSVIAGARYMKSLTARFHSRRAALIAYNEGPTAYAKGIRLGVSEKYASVADKVSGILFREALDSWLRQK